jgi:AcrR family transcriptional regulator
MIPYRPVRLHSTVPIGTVGVKYLTEFKSDMKAASRDRRRDEILDVAVTVLAKRGYREATMLEVAQTAAASKETLYAWFGDKRGLFEAVIQRNAEDLQGLLARHLEGDTPTEEVLVDFGQTLLELLLGDSSVAINRAAIAEVHTDPSLARILSNSGRDATLPGFVRFLEMQGVNGALQIEDAPKAAEDFLGLLLGDSQVRRLLDLSPAPKKAQIRARAGRATNNFLRLYGR